ncbi:hypothetical protein Ddye_016580 [Dipteronia dyeriana]|uniref:DNA helicase Pif1-like 2B domain-containing protein n=1 Tax=Dipteronia dyeriana TaxID=168575 RepID=A0AAD9U718_9ROSI|nr:hypothetical protein Ddye_016580 [Dipteronia dyeriana]
MRIKDSASFREWVLAVGDGKLPTVRLEEAEESSWIEIPEDLLILARENHIQNIVASTYPDIHTKYIEHKYLRERAILTHRNGIVGKINPYVLSEISGEKITYLSSDYICRASCDVNEQNIQFPVEFFNTLHFPSLPNHQLELKLGAPTICLEISTKVPALAMELG